MTDQPPSAGRFSGDHVRRRAAGTMGRSFERLASRLEDAAGRMEDIATQQLGGDGPRGRAGELAHAGASWMDSAADYLRTSDLEGMRSDFERTVRERPVQSLLVVAGVGWLLGKILR